jgi:heat shock protein HslJ
MHDETMKFQAVTPQATQPATRTRAPGRRIPRSTVVLWVIAGVLLAAAVGILAFGLFGPSPETPAVAATASVETTPAPQAPQPTEPEETRPEPETTPQPTDPTPAASGNEEGPSSEPLRPEPHVDPPEPDPEPEIHPLEGTLWDVMVLADGVGGYVDVHPSYPHQVEFRDGRMYTRGSLNSGSAEYSISGDEWGWGPDFMCGPIMTTMMAGPAEAMTQETRINTWLESAAYYEILENTLFIRDGSGETLLILDIVPGC